MLSTLTPLFPAFVRVNTTPKKETLPKKHTPPCFTRKQEKREKLFDLYALPKARFEVNIASRTRKRLIQVYEKLLLRSRRALSQLNLVPPTPEKAGGGEEKENTLTVTSATSERVVEFTPYELLGVFDKMLKDILNVMLDSLFRFRSTEKYEKLLKKIMADSAKKE